MGCWWPGLAPGDSSEVPPKKWGSFFTLSYDNSIFLFSPCAEVVLRSKPAEICVGYCLPLDRGLADPALCLLVSYGGPVSRSVLLLGVSCWTGLQKQQFLDYTHLREGARASWRDSRNLGLLLRSLPRIDTLSPHWPACLHPPNLATWPYARSKVGEGQEWGEDIPSLQGSKKRTSIEFVTT